MFLPSDMSGRCGRVFSGASALYAGLEPKTGSSVAGAKSPRMKLSCSLDRPDLLKWKVGTRLKFADAHRLTLARTTVVA